MPVASCLARLKTTPVMQTMNSVTRFEIFAEEREGAGPRLLTRPNQLASGPDAYHKTHYASLNLEWQLRKHLSIGWEARYGKKETQNGQTGDVWRFQADLVAAIKRCE